MYYIMGRAAAETVTRDNPDWAVLSIRDDGEAPLKLFGLRAALHLDFDDYPRACPTGQYRPMRQAQAKKIVEFARTVPAGQPMVIHCAQGYSRSAAVLLGVVAARGVDQPFHTLTQAVVSSQIRGFRDRDLGVNPNPRVVALLDIELGLDGLLVSETKARFGPAGKWARSVSEIMADAAD